MPQTDHIAQDDTIFRKSSRSFSNGNCVEVGIGPDQVQVRDSKIVPSPVLTFQRAAWAALIADIRAGQFR